MYNKFSFYSIVVQTAAPKGSSATKGLKNMHIRIEIETRFYINQIEKKNLDIIWFSITSPPKIL